MDRGITLCRKHFNDITTTHAKYGDNTPHGIGRIRDRVLVKGPMPFCPYCFVERQHGREVLLKEIDDFINKRPTASVLVSG